MAATVVNPEGSVTMQHNFNQMDNHYQSRSVPSQENHHNYNINNSSVPAVYVRNPSIDFDRNQYGRPLSYNEPGSVSMAHHIATDYPMSDTEQYQARSHRRSNTTDEMLMPPPNLPPKMRNTNQVKMRRKPPEIKNDDVNPYQHDADVQYLGSSDGLNGDQINYRRSYAGRQSSRSASPSRNRHSYSEAVLIREHSLSGKDLHEFAMNLDSKLPLLGSKRLSQASHSGDSKRSSYAADVSRGSSLAGSTSQRNSIVSGGGSKRSSYIDRRRSRGISMSECELDNLIDDLNAYDDNGDKIDAGNQGHSLLWSRGGSQRNSLSSPSGKGSQRNSHAETKYYTSNKIINNFHRYYVQPMNLCDPVEDMLGYTQLCALNLEDLTALTKSKLNVPIRYEEGDTFSSFNVRLWSRASGRYISIIEQGAAIYARAEFEEKCHLRMIVTGENRVCFMNNHNHSQLIQFNGFIPNAKSNGGPHCEFLLSQNSSGYVILESTSMPGHFLGVRENGNILPSNLVQPAQVNAQFIIQKQALDLL